MLVISRKVGEAIWLGDTRLVVLDVRGDQVRLGIQAPAEVRVLREELLAQVRQSNLEAVGVSLESLQEARSVLAPG